ncbi:MAG TPA: HAMP domain-containing sensor histidine kinase [Chitinophagaceae bacterium]|nr:HAMP domain-containing sensor histidine kinase [Chitinophagaceae bacterium]
MKTSAKAATIFIFFFFLFFNGVQVYLISQRIAGAKAKFNTACTNALLSTLFQYNKIKGTDTAVTPKNALITYTLNEMAVNRIDSQNIAVTAPTSRLYAIRVNPASIEAIINRPKSLTLELTFFGKLYQKALDSVKVHSEFRLDTFPIPFRTGNSRLDMLERINQAWALERTKEYPYSTSPQRIFFYPTALIFAELKWDYSFFIKDLAWPMLAFFFILLISNIALVFVYKTIRRQKRINEMKTDFINNITHEMKTPITITSAGLEALEHHITPTERTNFYLSTSKRQLRVLNDFIERILDAALQDIPDFTLKKEKIDLHALFADLLQSQSVLQGKSVNFQLTGEGPAFIHGDRLHLETAFHNIIDNAIKYSNGSVGIHIDIAENNRDCTIRIRDNGMGIPPQYIKHLFEKFFRVPQGDAQRIKGFGLGLYYVNNIIKKHAGHINVQSKLEAGTEFIITLPKTHDTDLIDRRPG